MASRFSKIGGSALRGAVSGLHGLAAPAATAQISEDALRQAEIAHADAVRKNAKLMKVGTLPGEHKNKPSRGGR